MPKAHIVTAIVEGQEIGGWQSGNFHSSMITAADTWVLRLPSTRTLWNTLRPDARIDIKVDRTTMISGFIGKRKHTGKKGLIEISGRDRVGRMCDETAPAIDYTGMTILEAAKRLADPWFPTPTLTDARNRNLRRGKGRRVAGGTEPVITINVRVPRRGQVHPGESRWHILHEIASRAGLIAYSSADGRELFIGKPNRNQAPQYLFVLAEPGSRTETTVRDMFVDEDYEDRFSLYLCAGVGGQGDTNYGTNVIDNRGVALDNPFNKIDGTGRDFIHPKRMFLPERAFDSYDDAERVAKNEKDRRDFHRHQVTVEMDTFGQYLGTSAATFFSPDTIARVVHEELEIDEPYLIYDCSFSFARDTGDVTVMHMVPSATEIIL
jgi:prophage tail gpP-like protein